MSRVKIKDIYYDGEVDSCEKVKNIEVVPRRIVEMIIAECNSQISDFHHNPSIVNTAIHIKDYTESLLNQFEEDDKWVNIPKGLSEEELQELELEEGTEA